MSKDTDATRVVITEETGFWLVMDTFWRDRIAQGDGDEGFKHCVDWAKRFCKKHSLEGFTVKLRVSEAKPVTEDEIGCDYCREDGPGSNAVCPKCDAEWHD